MLSHTTTEAEHQSPPSDPSAAPKSIKDRLTIVTTYYMLPSAPRMTVLRKTIVNVRKYLDVKGCRHLVYYHDPADGSKRCAEHLANLRKLCDEFGLELYVRPDSGIKVNLVEAIGEVKTPYMLFLEYDLAFRKKVDIAKLLDAFDKHKTINYVHFNTGMNDSRYLWGHLVRPEDRFTDVPLTQSSCWSNQAHVVRMSKWHDEWINIIGTDKPSSPIEGLEQVMYWRYNRDIFNDGFLEAQDRWGVYFYGEIDDGRFVHHTDGAGHSGTFVEYFKKAKRLVSRKLRDLKR